MTPELKPTTIVVGDVISLMIPDKRTLFDRIMRCPAKMVKRYYKAADNG